MSAPASALFIRQLCNLGLDPRLFNFTTTYDPGLLTGWGKRQTDWQYGIGVQQQLAPRVSAGPNSTAGPIAKPKVYVLRSSADVNSTSES